MPVNKTEISNGVNDFVNIYKKKGLIKSEAIGFDQVVKHIERARKDLRVAKANLAIDTEASYNYAYLAMLRSGRALMFSFGLRPLDGEQHKTVVAFCDFALGEKSAELVRRFDRMCKKRNRFTYDEAGLMVSETETAGAFAGAKQFVDKVAEFIHQKDPQRKLL